MVIELLILRQVIAFILTATAAFFDTKTGEIPDYLNYSAILLGLILNLVNFTPYAFLLAAGVFVLGYLFYLSGKIGGGDVKLFVALSLLIPFVSDRIFIVDLMLVASIVALIVISVYYSTRYYLKGINLEDNKKNLPFAAVFFVFSLVFFFISLTLLPTKGFVFLLAVPFLFASVFIAFERGIKKEFFLEKVSLSKLEEDELVAFDFIDKKTTKIILGDSKVQKGVLGSKEIENLKKAGIKNILVYRNLPKFAPFIFLALLLLFVFPDLISEIIFW